MNRLKIGIDQDGVVTHTTKAWFQYFNTKAEEHDHPIKNLDVGMEREWSFIEKQCNECFLYVLLTPELVDTYEPIPGAIAGVKSLAEIADLYMITSRPTELTEATHKWLDNHGIHDCFKDIIVMRGGKRDICEELGLYALVDDGPHNIDSLQGSSVLPIIFDAPCNQSTKGIRVYDWNQLIELIRVASITDKKLPQRKRQPTFA